jgi:hypothetical protein
MKLFASLSVLVLLLSPAAKPQAAAPNPLSLRPEQIPADCKAVDGDFPVDIQTAILWEKTDVYKGLIPVPIAKAAQSFSCQGDKGTVYVFQFENEGKRKRAAVFIKPLLWGETGPTAEHPELVLEIGSVLSVVSFRKVPRELLAALQGGTAAEAANQEATSSTDFQIPGHGILRLEIPDGWRSQVRQVTEPASVALHFAPGNGDAFDVQVAAVWLDATKLANVTTDSLKSVAQHAAEALLPRSVEKTVSLYEIRGHQSVGFYYALTDSGPGPGEFSNLTQGVFLTGEVLSTFTILHRTPTSPEVAQALRAFGDAVHVR